MPSSFLIDLPTLFAVTVFTVATGGVLLLFSWSQSRTATALAFWGFGYLLGACGAALLAARGWLPDAVSIVSANTLLCLAYGVCYGGAPASKAAPSICPGSCAGPCSGSRPSSSARSINRPRRV
jgi:hypothetical protein